MLDAMGVGGYTLRLVCLNNRPIRRFRIRKRRLRSFVWDPYGLERIYDLVLIAKK